MDLLWSPWRFSYVSAESPSDDSSKHFCVFCSILQNSASDKESMILQRAEFCFVILNKFPYSTGHLMVLPYEHIAEFDGINESVAAEFTALTQKCQRILRKVYDPNGFNIGINQGKAGGAGVAGHLHQHIVPRWIGDANFMTVVGETRTVPETLETTYEKLFTHF